MKRILVAYDGGEEGRRALDTAIELTRGLGTTLSVVSVVPIHPGRVPIDPWSDPQAHLDLLQEARTVVQAAGIKADYFDPSGDPARTIERIVDDNGYDVVVVGSRRLGVFGRVFQGSVSEHVATHANATVVVAR